MNKLQMAMFPPKTEWVPPIELPDLSDAKVIAIDVETRDPDLKTHGPGWARGVGEVVGYAVATEGWKGYLPVNHLGGGNLDKKIVSRWLKKVFETPADKVMHNAQYDAGWIKREGFTLNGKIIDTMMTAALVDENRYSYSLNALCYDHLGKTKSEKLLNEAASDFGVDPKGEMWKLPATYVGPYAEVDAELALELWQYFQTVLNREDLWAIHDLETRLLPHLVDMTYKGVRVDVDRAERTKQELMKREKDLLKRIKAMVGTDVEIWAPGSLAKAFDKLSIPYPKTDRGAPSFTKNFLTDHTHEFANMVVEAREINKAYGTFVNTILEHVGKDGRIHGHINQLRSDSGGTVSGRLSMSNPNLQQVPARNPEIGKMIRSLFLPEEGQQWAAVDFSQQEPRILVHYAHQYNKYKKGVIDGVDEFVRLYNEDPNTDFHTMVADIANIPRKQAKVINLGMMYGMGVNKLSEQLGIEKDEAKDIIRQYHTKVPFVKALMDGVSRQLDDPKSRGQIRSLKGRKCRFDLWEPDSFDMHKAMPYEEAVAAHGPHTRLKRAYTYKALNRLIQASAADMTKQAMVNVCEAGFSPMLQIHDELAFSVDNVEQARELADMMEQAVPLSVPNKCDIDIGPSWGEAKEVG